MAPGESDERRLTLPPRESLPALLLRAYRSRHAIPLLQRWMIFTAVPSAAVFVLLFLANAVWNGWGCAYDIMLAITSPWDRQQVDLPWLAFPLSFAGWLIMPALVSIVIGYTVDQSLKRQGRTVEQVLELLGGRAERSGGEQPDLDDPPAS